MPSKFFMKKVVCRYKNCNCLHDSKELDKEDSVRVGNQYFHKDCFQTKQDVNETAKIFADKINRNVVFSQLYNVINTIIFTKKVESGFLLFGLKYYIDHNIPLNYPQGLYYVIQNKDALNAYNKEKTKDIKKSVEIKEDNGSSFTFVPTKKSGFADILR